MKPAKYKIGDRVGVWLILAVEYSVDWQDWIYALERDKDGSRLRCSQSLLDRIVAKFCSTNKLT